MLITPRYRQGELYWCDPDPKLVDTVGREQIGDHVWLIVSHERRQRGNLVVGIPLSRHVEKEDPGLPFLIPVPASEITVLDGSESMNRIALTDQIRCLDKTRLRKQCGIISTRAVLSVLSGLDKLCGRQFAPTSVEKPN